MKKLIVATGLAITLAAAAISQETTTKPKPAAGRAIAPTAPAEPAARPLETGVMRTIAPERPAATTPAATAPRTSWSPAASFLLLLDRSDAVIASLTEKLLMYGLGRETTFADMPTVRAIMHGAAPQKYRLSDLILGVVNSIPFQWRVDDVKSGVNNRSAE